MIKLSYEFLIIDSIQTMYLPQIDSSPGTVTQVRACAHELIIAAKESNSILVLIGHVTKDGSIAGPRVLEHMVDTVLYFEGDNNFQYRVLRSMKNRFGPTNEIGVFEMLNVGLKEIMNPSKLFLSDRQKDVSGSAIFAGLEGTRPILIEVQALVMPSSLASPRRTIVGWDTARLSMLSAVLKSKTAIETSIKIIESFVNMRRILSSNNQLFQRLEQIEKRQISYELKSDEKFDKIFDAIEEKSIKPKQGIFYDGQVYDAYIFISDLIKSANKSLVLIDNYVDDTVLTLLSKRNPKVDATIYIKNISKQLELDLKKHNTQYDEIKIKKFENAHDRFLIIDEKEIYHIGASLKDLGKKWFAFSKLDIEALDMLSKIKGN